MNVTSNKRLLALDVMRGITIAGMILVNNPGSWGYVYFPLKHAQWNGLTPTDLIFPFFMFIMGISTYISFRKYNFTFSTPAALKIIKRTIVIFLIGIAINWFALLCYYHDPLPFAQIRINCLAYYPLSDRRLISGLLHTPHHRQRLCLQRNEHSFHCRP